MPSLPRRAPLWAPGECLVSRGDQVQVRVRVVMTVTCTPERLLHRQQNRRPGSSEGLSVGNTRRTRPHDGHLRKLELGHACHHKLSISWIPSSIPYRLLINLHGHAQSGLFSAITSFSSRSRDTDGATVV